MSETHAPFSLQAAYDLACVEGDYFPEPRNTTTLDGVSFTHPRKGQVDITIDEHALAAQGQVYTDHPALRATLQERGIWVAPLATANQVIGAHLESDELVWGFSGYATAGYSYLTEAKGLTRLYDHLAATDNKPGLVVDGGVSAGSLGLSGIIASMHHVPTMGMIPLQGLASVGLRDHLVVWGNTYQDREALVGTTPDILVCIGGGEGTQRECQKALSVGGKVILLALSEEYAPNALPNTYQTFDDMSTAVDSGDMVICRSMDAIRENVDLIIQAARGNERMSRIAAVGQLLAKATV